MSPILVSICILVWMGVITFLLAFLFFIFKGVDHRKGMRLLGVSSHLLVLPALVLAPLLIGSFFDLFGWNLVFPIQIGEEFLLLFFSLLPPSLVLVICSGMLKVLFEELELGRKQWLDKPCATMISAMGFSPLKRMGKTIFLQAQLRSWSLTLPWVFGELLVVECVFNAPGIGYTIWSQAKERQVENLVLSLVTLVSVYFVVQLLNQAMGRWLGRRLENYV